MPNYVDGAGRFVNPYNFIPLKGSCNKNLKYREKKAQGRFTGWVDCTMKTLSPVFIPNTSEVFNKRITGVENNQYELHSYDFFSYTDLRSSPAGGIDVMVPPSPVIPGSEIRGMFRSAYEAVTNSCMSTIDDGQLLYKRTTLVGKPGRLRRIGETWKIQPCERVGIAARRTRGDGHDFSAFITTLTEGQEVYIQKSADKYQTSRGFPAFYFVDDIKLAACPGYDRGYYHLGEPFGSRKHHESVFVPTGAAAFDVDKQAVENLRTNLELSRDTTVNIHLKKGHKGYKHINNMDGALVYYDTHNGAHYLSPAAIGREVYHKKLTEIVNSYAPCAKLDQLCPACSLFGLAGRDESAASRVRFTDALPVAGAPLAFDSPRILRELASPKLSATEFYLKKPAGGADLWNYDYAMKWQRRQDGSINAGQRPTDVPGYKAALRGRKFYWHHQAPSPYINENQASDRNAHVRPLNDGTFSFRLYFNTISRDELDSLLWVLEIGGSPDHGHKIGMGKPAGMGSVRIAVDKITVRSFEKKQGTLSYALANPGKPDYAVVEKKIAEMGTQSILNDYKKITDFVHAPANVAYPHNDENIQEVYAWFVANKTNKGTGTAHVIDQELKPIAAPVMSSYREAAQQRPQHGQQRGFNRGGRR